MLVESADTREKTVEWKARMHERRITPFLLTSLIFLLIFNAGTGLKFIAIGDWGCTTTRNGTQVEVAMAMERWAKENGPLDFIVTTGDNFYPRGVASPDSERFNVTWRNIYNCGALQNIPWYVALGNHDYYKGGREDDGRELHQVAFTKSDSSWILPHVWHSKLFPLGEHGLHLVILDTTALMTRRHNTSQQMAWFVQEMESSAATWKVLVTHHPYVSSGKNGPYGNFIKRIVMPTAIRYGVDVMLSGHDHALEHLCASDGSGPDYVISGAGGKEPYLLKIKNQNILKDTGFNVTFFESENGFVTFNVSANTMLVEYYTRFYKRVHSFKKYKGTGYRHMHTIDIS